VYEIMLKNVVESERAERAEMTV